MDIVCTKCGRLMKPDKIGVTALELIEEGGRPYRTYSYDEYKCPKCDHIILCGNGAPSYDLSDISSVDYTYW